MSSELPDQSVYCDHPWHRNPGLIVPCPECGEGRDEYETEAIGEQSQ